MMNYLSEAYKSKFGNFYFYKLLENLNEKQHYFNIPFNFIFESELVI